jgi:hypothetical protein
LKLCIEKWLKSNDRILYYDNAPVPKQFLTQKSITEKEHPPYSPDFAPNDFWLFPINSVLKRDKDFRILKTLKESYSTRRIPEIYPTVAASLG